MPRRCRGKLALSASLLSIVAAMSAPSAHAQESSPENVIVLDTISVTGEKVTRDLKETASSVTVISAEEIENQRAGKDDVRGVIAGTPNVIYADSVSTPIIRGQNTEGPHTGANAFFAGSVPRATINLDGHYLSYNEFYFGATSTWDVENIEVFRGPQTTTQGANAIAGAIVVNTKDPTFTPEGAYRFEAGNYNQRRASLAWSGPINDQLAARISLDYSGRDTFIDYVGSSFIQNSIGQDFKSTNARAKLLWVPTEIDGLEAKLTLSHSEMTRPSAEGSGPPYDRLESITTWMPGWEQTTDTAILDVDYNLGNGLILSNQGQFSTSDVERRVGTPTAGDADVDQDNYTNETKLTYGTPTDTLSGVAGVYMAYTTQNETLNQGGISTFKDQKHNLGIYGELGWRIDERWTLTGGLRYQRDQIRRTGDVVASFANSDVDYDHTFEEVLPKLTLSYDATPQWTVGAMVSKGYNPGGVSLDFYSSKEWEKFDAETVWNYELFTRANLLNDKLFLTGNLFYMDYRNAQQNITQTIGGTTYVHTINADKAEAYGLEVGLDYRPIESLTLRTSAGLLHTDFTRFSDATAYEGNEFARAPGKTLSLGASWDVNDRLNIGGQVRYVDGYYSNTANTPAYAIDGYTLVDVQASYKIRDGLEVYGYANNIFDERTPVLLESARGDVVFTQASMTTPRMVGIGIRGSF
ncbi:TonB-dependent receptor [Paenirhodobacter populi]|uniref:TonB-dependent receptor n=3 Tax=Paenirhodobacter populi TaxID=2306993 RepID=A0A443JLV8_9RHOB|nr:TonB-dependent receptor [Sinirhodobacter populi]RWR21489.1 TonB-dependent receptor [Sinirhodobacter populi]